MLTALLIKRRAQSPMDDRLSTRRQFRLAHVISKASAAEIADAARDPPLGTARSHIAGATKATPR